MTPDPDWERQALTLALKKCPQTSWEPSPVWDSKRRRMPLENMRAQLYEEALLARGKIGLAPEQWATTGKWPSLRNAAAWFQRESIRVALEQCGTEGTRGSNRAVFAGPPWSAEVAAWLTRSTTDRWYRDHLNQWADEAAREAWEAQEDLEDLLGDQ